MIADVLNQQERLTSAAKQESVASLARAACSSRRADVPSDKLLISIVHIRNTVQNHVAHHCVTAASHCSQGTSLKPVLARQAAYKDAIRLKLC